MSRKPRSTTRPPEDSPDTLPDRFPLMVHRIPNQSKVYMSKLGLTVTNA